jgi:hypothetical protein
MADTQFSRELLNTHVRLKVPGKRPQGEEIRQPNRVPNVENVLQARGELAVELNQCIPTRHDSIGLLQGKPLD